MPESFDNNTTTIINTANTYNSPPKKFINLHPSAKNHFESYILLFEGDTVSIARDQGNKYPRIQEDTGFFSELTPLKVTQTADAFFAVQQQCIADFVQLTKNSFVGSTCIIGGTYDNEILLGNIGDSRCYQVNVSHQSVTCEYMTCDQIPRVPTERQLILNNGGNIYQEYVNGQLAITRALGDKNFPVTREAEYTRFKYKPNVHVKQYLLVCSDGITEKLSREDIQHIFDTHRHHPNLAEIILNEALMRGNVHDNSIALVIPLKSNMFSLFGVLDGHASQGTNDVNLISGMLSDEFTDLFLKKSLVNNQFFIESNRLSLLSYYIENGAKHYPAKHGLLSVKSPIKHWQAPLSQIRCDNSAGEHSSELMQQLTKYQDALLKSYGSKPIHMQDPITNCIRNLAFVLTHVVLNPVTQNRLDVLNEFVEFANEQYPQQSQFSMLRFLFAGAVGFILGCCTGFLLATALPQVKEYRALFTLTLALTGTAASLIAYSCLYSKSNNDRDQLLTEATEYINNQSVI